jgi:hypothetical protein|tara:strand:- start:450 stop:890 length:441 start_codon:yes stop_codon:yes gene_type:complete
MRARDLLGKMIPRYFGLGSLGGVLEEGKGILNRGTQAHRQKKKYHRPSHSDEDHGDDTLERAMDKVYDIRVWRYTQEEQEALVKAGIATHNFQDAKQLAIDGEYPVEDFQIPYGNVKVFYWPNREIGKPYTLWHGGLPQDEEGYDE